MLGCDGLRWTQNAPAEICKKLYSQSRSMELPLTHVITALNDAWCAATAMTSNKQTKPTLLFPLHLLQPPQLPKIKRLTKRGLTLSYSTGFPSVSSIQLFFSMRDANAWMLAADTRLFFPVRNQIFKDQKVRSFEIPRLFCLCCHGSNLDYCKNKTKTKKTSCVHEYRVAVTTSAWWAPIERWSKLYDSARTAPNEIWSWGCSCVQSGSLISWHRLSFHFTASFINQPHLCPN